MFKFEIFKDWQGEFRWRLRSRLGQVVATSAASYQSQEIARRAAQEVRVSAGEAEVGLEQRAA
jgi:uncharacterized protein YegP (UPF0339 family)